jgi:hypothetical protein
VPTQSQTVPATTAPTTEPAAFTLSVTGQSGDSGIVEGRFAPIVRASESGAETTALDDCGATTDRSYALRLDLTATVTSSLAADVSLLQFESDNWAPKNMDIILSSEGSETCAISGDSTVDFGELQPHQLASATVWLILPNTITPNEPSPVLKRLTSEFRLRVPELSVGSSVTDTPTTTGPRIAICGNYLSGTDKFIAISTDVAPTMKNVTGEEETDCAAG